jgi:putative ABC transport system permease protein
MKWVVALLLVVLGAVSFASSFLSEQDAQRSRMVRAAELVGTPFTIPGSLEFADPQVVYPALVDAAKATKVNVLRTGAGYTAHGAFEITQYALLTGGTRLYSAFSLRSGRWLSSKETISGNDYLSTRGKVRGSQVGVLSDFGGRDLVSIRPLHEAFESSPVAGTYFVELTPGSAALHPYHRFLSLLAQEVTDRLVAESDRTLGTRVRLAEPVTARAFTFSGEALFTVPASNVGRLLRALEYLVEATTLLLLVYGMLYQAKRVGVLRLCGFGVLRVWYLVTVRLVLGVMTTVAVLSLCAALSVPGMTWGFVVGVEAALLRATLVALGCSLVTAGYIWRTRLSEALKNRKDTRGIFALNTVVKAVCSVAVVVVGAGLWLQWSAASSERARLGDWAATKYYGIFYPVEVGDDLVALETGQPGPKTAEVYDLYPLLDRRGALYIDASDYEPGVVPSHSGAYRSIVVNPNYLHAYPLHDAAGQVVTVPESTTDWVLLVPTVLRPQRARVLSYFEQLRRVNVGESESWFGRAASTAVAHQRVLIIWMPRHYEVFSFNPYVNPRRENMVSDPIVQVMTLSNSVGLDRANAITGGPSTALKVRLAPGGPNATLRQLEPALKRMKLNDNLTYLVTMNDWVFEQVHQLRQQMWDIAIAAAVLVVAMLAFVGQGLAISFERFARRVVVRRLFGFGLWRAHRETLLAIGATSLFQGLAALAANAAGLGLYSGQPGTVGADVASPWVVLVLVAVVAASEVAFATFWLAYLERRRLTTVLKEEF